MVGLNAFMRGHECLKIVIANYTCGEIFVLLRSWVVCSPITTLQYQA